MKKKIFISVKPCPMLYVPPNAMISPVNCTKGPSLGGAICTVTCKAGYTLIGQPKVSFFRILICTGNVNKNVHLIFISCDMYV
jgi:hypothetical protein